MPLYDPLSDEASQLGDEEKLLLAASLRRSGVGPAWLQVAQNSMDRSAAQGQLQELRSRRQAQQAAETAAQQRIAGLSNPTPQDLMGSLSTRPAGTELLKRKIQQDQDQAAFEAQLRSLRGQPAPQIQPNPSPMPEMGGMPPQQGGRALPSSVSSMNPLAQMSDQDLQVLAAGTQPQIAKLAAEQLKYRTTGKNMNYLYPDTSGQYTMDPNQEDAIKRRELARGEGDAAFRLNSRPVGGGTSEVMTDLEYMKRRGSPTTPTALPNVAATFSGATPSPSPVAAASSPGQGAMPVSSASGVVPPEVQLQREYQRFTTLAKELEKEKQTPSPIQKQNIQAITREMQDSVQKIQALSSTNPPQPNPTKVSAPPMAQMGQAPLGNSPAGAPGFGQTNPQWEERAALFNKENAARLKTFIDAGDKATNVMMITKDLAELSDRALAGGLAGAATRAGATVSGALGLPVPESVSNSEQFAARAGGLFKDMLSAFGSGNGISNLDLMTVKDQLPDLAKSHEGRQKIIAAMYKAADINKYNADKAREDYMANRPIQFDTTAGGKYPVNPERGRGAEHVSPMTMIPDMAKNAGTVLKTLVDPQVQMNMGRGFADTLSDEPQGPILSGEGYQQGRAMPEGLLAGSMLAGGAGAARGVASAGASMLPGVRGMIARWLARRETSALPNASRMQFRSGRPYNYTE